MQSGKYHVSLTVKLKKIEINFISKVAEKEVWEKEKGILQGMKFYTK